MWGSTIVPQEPRMLASAHECTMTTTQWSAAKSVRSQMLVLRLARDPMSTCDSIEAFDPTPLCNRLAPMLRENHVPRPAIKYCITPFVSDSDHAGYPDEVGRLV